MAGKWSHINAFIRNKGDVKKKRQLETKEKRPVRSVLKAQVVKPVQTFDLKIDTFLSYVINTIARPYAIVKDEQSSRYFIYGVFNFLIYLFIIFLLGTFKGQGIDMMKGLYHTLAGGLFAFVAILFTFFIQLLSINRFNTFYKVFVDMVSYFTIVSVIGLIQFILQLLQLNYSHNLDIISFLALMSIPMRLFHNYNEHHKFEIDIFKLNVIFIILMVIYMAITRDIPWLSFYEEI